MVMRVIAVSDVHIGTKRSNRDAFLSFLQEVCDTPDVDALVLLGDIFDFWRVNNAKAAIENADIAEVIANLRAKKVYYVVGNHDYHFLRLAGEFPGTFPFEVSRELRLQCGDRSFYFVHGYQIEVHVSMESLTMERYEKFADRMCSSSNIFGYIADHFWEVVEESAFVFENLKMRFSPHKRRDIDRVYTFAKSQGAYLLLGMKPGECLVYGHTHRPFITMDNRVANTGCWTNDKEISEKWRNTYVEIIDGDVYLRKYPY